MGARVRDAFGLDVCVVVIEKLSETVGCNDAKLAFTACVVSVVPGGPSPGKMALKPGEGVQMVTVASGMVPGDVGMDKSTKVPSPREVVTGAEVSAMTSADLTFLFAALEAVVARFCFVGTGVD